MRSQQQAEIGAALDAVDAGYAQLRAACSDSVGNGYRLNIAERLERQHRLNRGQMYRFFGELVDPPDGPDDPDLPRGTVISKALWQRLRITRREAVGAATVGVLLLALGNGAVAVAEQTVPSGLAALLVATVPLWMVAADRLVNGRPVTPLAAIALAMGLLGVGILSQPGTHGGELTGVLVALVAAASWGTSPSSAERAASA